MSGPDDSHRCRGGGRRHHSWSGGTAEHMSKVCLATKASLQARPTTVTVEAVEEEKIGL